MRKTILVAVLSAIVGALVATPVAVYATHSFTDVSPTHTFHSDIEWLKTAGVTKGCNPPDNTLFCPDDPVTRGQMSAFMRRFAQYIDAVDGTPGLADHATTADNATTANSASTADHATTADHAATANSASTADHATTADSATSADSATLADHATTADSATSADSATLADHATTADSATNAGHATTATNWNPPFVTIPAAAFRPSTLTDPFVFEMTGAFYVRANVPNTTLCVVAPVFLPDGATIQALTGYVFDNDATFQMSIGIFRRHLTDATISGQAIATALATSDSSQVQQITDSTPEPDKAVVDNSTWGYLLSTCFAFSGLDAGVLRLYGARVDLSYP